MPELRIVLTIVAMLAAMLVASGIGLRQRSGIAVLALLSFAWFTLDQSFEGGVLVTLSHTHSVVAADLVGVVGLLTAACLWWRLHRRGK